MAADETPGLGGDPQWYKDAVLYEVPVRAFYDSNADGVGDFEGLTEKLDYIQDLGVTAIWLLPFYPSPLKDDGYDIADYRGVHPSYGSLQEFRAFLREAHSRGIRVITELVVNHTSDQHPWFQRARRSAPGSRWRQFYVWSDRADKYNDARIIFKDFEASNWTWDPVAGAYYWHRFFSHQPDLNFESPDVRRAIFQVADFWLRMGVDGMRLDAVPYLYEAEGTSCENLPQTHAFLKELRAHIDKHFPNRMLLGEANQWPDEAAQYFGNDDECHMAYHFPVMPRLFMAVRTEDRFPIVDILRQTPAIPEKSQWALFLRNHDELTLEMVTDEDRDYMYRVYAQDPEARINLGIRRRLAPLLGNHRRRIELMNALLFSLPGTPVVYYGDEIGMGDNIYLGDRNGVRTPMPWSSDRNAGFSRTNPQRLYLPVIVDPEYHYEALNVEAQQANPHSLLWWTKRLIALRRRFHAFGRGSLEMLSPDNPKILAFARQYGEERILVVANLSRFAQAVNLDLSPWAGMTPVEMFGRTVFPAIGESPYFLTLAPHTFFWFVLERQRVEQPTRPPVPRAVPVLVLSGAWGNLLEGRQKSRFEALLPDYIRERRWFGGKAREIQSIVVQDALPIGETDDPPQGYLLNLQVEYLDAEPEGYVLPVTVVAGQRAAQILADSPHAVIARLETRDGDSDSLLVDAVWDAPFSQLLLQMIAGRRRTRGEVGELVGVRGPRLSGARGKTESLEPQLGTAEQSNTSVVFGGRMILKLFRRSEEGVNPELEMGRFLTERRSFPNVPRIEGYLEYRVGRRQPRTIGVLQEYLPNQGDAWRFTLDDLALYFDRVRAHLPVSPPDAQNGRIPGEGGPPGPLTTIEIGEKGIPDEPFGLIGPYLEAARLLGQRTAELHLTLASDPDDVAFSPEPFTLFYQRSVYQAFRGTAFQSLQLLRRRRHTLPPELQAQIDAVLASEEAILHRYAFLLGPAIETVRMRIHGDLHLGQVLRTEGDFCIIDFEGEPARPLSERRIKRAAMRDLAGMLRSFNYASQAALKEEVERGLSPSDLPKLEPWADYWCSWTSTAFLNGYLATAGEASFIPRGRGDLRRLLGALLLDKAMYELAYEMNNRPTWVGVPLKGILQLLGDEDGN